jgi:hypothetical protein
VKGLTFKNCEIAYESTNEKPVMIFEDVHKLTLDHFKLPKPLGMETIRLDKTSDVEIRDCEGLKSETIANAEKETR